MLDALPADIAILIIEHDMDLVFRFARRITVLVQGSVLVEGTPDEIAARSRACATSTSAKQRMADALRCPACAPATARPWCSRTSRSRSPERGSLAVLGRNGVGKTTLLATIMGHTTFHAGAIQLRRDATIQRLPVYERKRLGIGYVPQGRDIFPSLTRRGEPHRRAQRAGTLDARARLRSLPAPRASAAHHRGNQISGGEQQMLAIGRALMGNPTLLLMDEPLEGLAPIIVETLLASLKRLMREDALAVVLVEQHAKLALQVTNERSS